MIITITDGSRLTTMTGTTTDVSYLLIIYIPSDRDLEQQLSS